MTCIGAASPTLSSGCSSSLQLLLRYASPALTSAPASISIFTNASSVQSRFNAACNALLKTLEEPQPGRYLWLLASDPARLPATPSKWAGSMARSRRPARSSCAATSRPAWCTRTMPPPRVTRTRSPINRHGTE